MDDNLPPECKDALDGGLRQEAVAIVVSGPAAQTPHRVVERTDFHRHPGRVGCELGYHGALSSRKSPC